MDTTNLDQFSRDVAKLLFTEFPQWQSLAKTERAEDGTTYLKLDVQTPHESSTACGLSIITPYSEMIVEFDYYEGHYGGQVGDGGAEAAAGFVIDLVSEKIPVISWWKDSELVAWSTIMNGRPLLPSNLVGLHDHVRVRSWKGTLNADYDT